MIALVEPAGEQRMHWYGVQTDVLKATDRELDVEGALRSSKTTLSLRKERVRRDYGRLSHLRRTQVKREDESRCHDAPPPA